LNKTVLNEFVENNKSLKNKCTQTPNGTYFNSNIENKINKKKCKFVFISRLVNGKGVDKFLEIIPSIDKIVKTKELTPSFHI